MAAGDLSQAQFATAFDFGRTEAGTYRGPDGAAINGVSGEPRFDHDIEGSPRGLLVKSGYDLGGGDRVAIKVAALPDGVFDPLTPGASDVTILHRYAPAVTDDSAWAEFRRAWYKLRIFRAARHVHQAQLQHRHNDHARQAEIGLSAAQEGPHGALIERKRRGLHVHAMSPC